MSSEPETSLLVGRYELERPISTGPASTVWRARDVLTNNCVVIKRFAENDLHAYRREAAAALELQHPNVNRYVDTFVLASGAGGIVYDFVQGGSLGKRLKRGRFDRTNFVRAISDILAGIEHLHSKGFVHCDLKPENILFRPDPIQRGQGTYIIGDPGAASPIREALDGVHRTGSPAYVAPERLYDHFSFNSDLYSVGVIGFQLLTGSLPFTGTTTQIYRAHMASEPAFGDIADPELREFVAALMRKDPATRIPKAKEAREMLMCLAQKATDAESITGALVSRAKGITSHQVPDSLELFGQFHVSRMPTAIHAVNSDGLSALEYPNFLQLHQASGEAKNPIVLSGGPFVVDPYGRIFYPASTGVTIFDPTANVRTNINLPMRKVGSLGVDETRVVAAGQNGACLYDFASDTCSAFPLNAYSMNADIQLAGDAFVATSGHANNCVTLRDFQGALQRRWSLDGPVDDLATDGTAVLAVSLSMSGQNSFSVWQLDLLGSRKIEMPGFVASASTGRSLFVVEQDATVWHIGLDGTATICGQLSRVPKMIAVDRTGSVLVSVVANGAGGLMSVHKLRCSKEIQK